MLKAIFLASAVMISAPALAQDQTAPASPAQTSPATDPLTQTSPTTTPDSQAPTTQAAPVTGAQQIAQVIDSEFPTYDKDADGNLDKTEFGAWMVALKTASDPTTKADDPATSAWVNGAFASADTDKSALVSKGELTAYLSKSASGD